MLEIDRFNLKLNLTPAPLAGLAAMLERYLGLQRGGDPVHTWPLPDTE